MEEMFQEVMMQKRTSTIIDVLFTKLSILVKKEQLHIRLCHTPLL